MIENASRRIKRTKRSGCWNDWLIWLGLLLWLTALGWSACAHADDGQREARRLRETGRILSLDQIVERARAIHPGKLLDGELEREDGRYVYELELLDEHGVVWELTFDAATGALLKREGED